MAGIYSKEAENGARLTFLVSKEGTKALRTALVVYSTRKYTKPSFENVLQDHRVKTKIKNICGKGKPKGPWFILYGRHFPQVNAHKLGKPETFDITLTFLLLRNICGLSPPRVQGTLPSWDNKPDPNDTSFEANLARIKYYRNFLAHHETGAISDHDFDDIFESLKQSILGISATLSLPPPQWSVTSEELERFRTDSISPDDAKEAAQIRKDWEKEETDIIEKLNHVVESLNKYGGQMGTEILEIKQCIHDIFDLQNKTHNEMLYIKQQVQLNEVAMEFIILKLLTNSQGFAERGPDDIKTTEESVISTMIEQAAIYFWQKLEPNWEAYLDDDDIDAIEAAEKVNTEIKITYENTKEKFLSIHPNAEREFKAKMQEIVNDKVKKMEKELTPMIACIAILQSVGVVGVVATVGRIVGGDYAGVVTYWVSVFAASAIAGAARTASKITRVSPRIRSNHGKRLLHIIKLKESPEKVLNEL